ncbi:hypothetical protein ACFQ2B_23275 [Streptomyces stramineus]
MTTALPRLAPAYVGAVAIGSYAVHRLLAPSVRARLLRRCSTNADNLDAGRWDTLVASALLAEGPLELPYALLLLAVLGYAEYAYGAWWAAGTFAFGHVGASLLVYGGCARSAPGAYAVGDRCRPELRPPRRAGRARRAVAPGRCADQCVRRSSRAHRAPLLRGRPGFTDVGHLAALVLGIALVPGCERALHYRPGRNPPQ